MARVRRIERNPKEGRNYYISDACFLANKYIDARLTPDQTERRRILACQEWWKEIDRQIDRLKARIYLPDICIAEAFKVLAKKYHDEKWLKYNDYVQARSELEQDVHIPNKNLKSSSRYIRYHDISTNRDLIISVDRFYGLFMKHKSHVELPDLIVVATAKYLIDFYDIPKNRLHIITLDSALWKGTKKIPELPNAYDPTNIKDRFGRVFV